MKKQQLPKQTARATIDSKSINSDLKQFDVVFATETPVFRRHWEENFYEILSCKKEHMRTERLDAGMVPLLDNHNKWNGVAGQYGSVISWDIKEGECRATIQFSSRAELQGIWQDIESGIIRGISAGYIPWVFSRAIVAERKEPNYTAIDWEVMEISLAPIPADYRSKVRSEAGEDAEGETYEVTIQNFNNVQNNRSNMKENEATVVEQATTTTTNEEGGSRSAQAPTTVNVTVQPVDEGKIRSEAAIAERQRGNDIRFAVRAAKLDDTFADQLIADGVTVDAARTAIINKLAEADTTNVRTAQGPANVTVTGADEADKTRNAMGDALMHRANPGSVVLEDKAHDFKYMSMIDMARHCILLSGDKNAMRYPPSEVVKRAISTTDYPTLLNSTVERAIRKTYDAQPAEWKNIARKTTSKDFREKSGIAVDGKVTFEEIAEGGDYKHSALIMDEKATIKLKTYGRMIKITRQAIINDDLSVFEKLPRMIALGASNFQADKVWALLTGNAKTPDGKTMFHADHTNLAAAGAGSALSEASLSAARIAMYRQKTLAGERFPQTPKYLVVPIELEMTAKKLMTAITASNTTDVNTVAGAYTILTSPLLTNANEWYLAADPQAVEGLVYAYLEGEEGLFIDKEVSFENDSVTTKARLDFAAAVWDHRGWYKSPGA